LQEVLRVGPHLAVVEDDDERDEDAVQDLGSSKKSGINFTRSGINFTRSWITFTRSGINFTISGINFKISGSILQDLGSILKDLGQFYKIWDQFYKALLRPKTLSKKFNPQFVNFATMYSV
jgi:hypothetical protein